jgi:hypothetical protein
MTAAVEQTPILTLPIMEFKALVLVFWKNVGLRVVGF